MHPESASCASALVPGWTEHRESVLSCVARVQGVVGTYDESAAGMFAPEVVDAVHGVDSSRAMIARLRAKPGGEAITVSIGDVATTRVASTFSVAYLVFNTIMNLTTQAAEVACFRNVAAHLESGGCFIIEVALPDLRRLPPGQNVVPFPVSSTRWAYDVTTQVTSSNYVEVVDGHGEYRSIPFRYVWPPRLDARSLAAPPQDQRRDR